ncbi:hypothetical protein NL676_019509 [Syzygium grande]|nr:hypothetical protein NL676_019509 [Syzygium grande]
MPGENTVTGDKTTVFCRIASAHAPCVLLVRRSLTGDGFSSPHPPPPPPPQACSSSTDSVSDAENLMWVSTLFVLEVKVLSPCRRGICVISACAARACMLWRNPRRSGSPSVMRWGLSPHRDLIEWRKGVSSYKALCRFLFCVQPLIGIWVHQNPELGNVVYVMPGFVSVVGCRIIPQELGPLGIEDGPILWAPVFEVIGDFDGSASFFLHGREKGIDYVYPGSLRHIDRNCNVLLLEVEPRVLEQNETKVPFSRLAFCDRRKLLEVVTNQVRQKVPNSAGGPLFARLRDDDENFRKDMLLLNERRSLIIQMQSCKFGGWQSDSCPEMPSDLTQLGLSEIRKSLDRSSGTINSFDSDNALAQCAKKKTFGGYFRYGIKQILGKSISFNGGGHAVLRNSSSSSESKHAQLHEFLRSGDMIGLTLNASTVKLSSYRAWPNMHDSRFALYKLPLRLPKPDQEYAGLWGGTFGWPPREAYRR